MVKRKTQSERSEARPDFLRQLEDNKNFFWFYAGATLLFTLILFHKFVFSGAGQMLYGSDTIQAGVFWRTYVTDHFQQIGAWLPLNPPVWNPFLFGGLPPVDAFHGDIFYLPTFILKELWPVQEIYKPMGWGLVLHVYLAGLFAYTCARGFGLSRLASAFAGVSYMFSGYLISLVAPGHDGKMFVTALFPLAFHFLNRGMGTRQLKWFLGLGLTIAFIILTPHPQMAYFSLWALGLFFLYRVVFMFKDKIGVIKITLSTAMFVLAVVIGLFGSAIQMWPSYKYIVEFSPRAGEGSEGRGGYEWATSWSMHWEEAIGQFIPLFHGVDDRKDEGGYWGRNAFKDNTEYAGFFPFFFGILAVILWRNRETWFLLGLGILALIYALGDTTPLFRIFYELVPNVKKMRAPSMIMFLFSFAFCMLAAYGIDALARLRSEKKGATTASLNKWLMIIAGVITAKALLFTISGESMMRVYTSIFYSGISPDNAQTMVGTLPTIKISLWLIAGLFWLVVWLIRGFTQGSFGRIALVIFTFASLVDLWRVDFRFIEIANFSQYFPGLPVVARFKLEEAPFRIMDLTRRSFSSKNYFAMSGVEQIVGYHGAQLKSFDEFVGGLAYKNLFSEQGLNLRTLQLTNTRYIVLDRGTAFPEANGIRKFYDNEVAVYELPEVLPRAVVYHDYTIGARDQSDLDTLLNAAFPFRSRVILYDEPEYRPTAPPADANETIEIVERGMEKQVYKASLAAPGILFISENYFPAWKVKVNGGDRKLHLANHTFRAVSLDAGVSEVEIYYDWPRFETGRSVTVFTFIGSLLALAACVVVERKSKGSEV